MSAATHAAAMPAGPPPGSIEPLAMLLCSNCGAGLPVRHGDDHARCAFCQHASPVDAARLKWQRRLPEAAMTAEQEGLSALRHALTAKLTPSRGAVWGSYGVVFTAGLFVSLVLMFAVGRGGHVGISMLVTWLGGAIASALGFRYLRRRAGGLAEEELQHVHAQIQREPGRGACPECGVALVVPPLTAGIDCAYCGSALLAAAGMLVKWVTDAGVRRQAWARQAAAVLERVRLHHKRMDRLAGFLLYGLPWLLVLGLAGVMLLLGSLGMSPQIRANTPDPGDKVWVKDGKLVAELVVVEVYGKLCLVDNPPYGRRWVSLEHDFQTSRDPGPAPKDEPAALEIGARVLAPGAGGDPLPATVEAVYGRLVRVKIGSQSRWVEARAVTATGSATTRPTKRRRGPRRRR
jgi:hypothetical protein